MYYHIWDLNSYCIRCFVTFATSSAANVLWVLVGMVAVHAVDGNIIMPKIVGSQVKLNSLIVIIGLIVGESIWGVMGMFLTIPIMAIAKIIFDRVEDLKPWGYLMGMMTMQKNMEMKSFCQLKRMRQKWK